MKKADFIHGWNRCVLPSGLIFFVVFEICVIGISAIALADVTFSLGWSYKAEDMWIGLLLAVFGLVVFGFYWAINKLVGRLNTRFYGPESDR